jgi:uncharacterized protein
MVKLAMVDLKLQKISEIEKEIRETPYHKGTEHHIGMLRARLAKLRTDYYQTSNSSGGGVGRGYAVRKQGDATVAIVGPPSVGKSTLLNLFANTSSQVGSYDFTTTQVIPGMMNLNGARIQFFDLPGLIDEGSLGKGSGKKILSVARVADLFLLVTDKDNFSKFNKILSELYKAGFRLNQSSPKIEIRKTLRGSIRLVDPFSSFPKETIRKIVEEFGYKNAEVIFKEKITDIGIFIDALSPNRKYLPAVVAVNKSETMFEKDKNALLKDCSFKKDGLIFISAHKNIGIKKLKQLLWQKLEFVRVYLKRGEKLSPDNQPLIINKGTTIAKMVGKINSNWEGLVTGALVWGKKVKFSGQKVSLSYQPEDQDVVFLIKKF